LKFDKDKLALSHVNIFTNSLVQPEKSHATSARLCSKLSWLGLLSNHEAKVLDRHANT